MARRRNIPKAKPKAKAKPKPAPPVVDHRLKKEYAYYNPMREVAIEDEEEACLAHELGKEDFLEYLILNGMSEEGYWLNVKAGEDQAADIEKNGIPLRNDQLTPDQKGWAKVEFPDHYQKEDVARWRPVPGKDSKVRPWPHVLRVHDRLYREACDDGEDAKLALWGYRWDMRELWQCQVCGEVIVKPLTISITNGDTNDEDRTDLGSTEQAA